MQRGTIKKLVAEKGFGFIAGGAKGKDLFLPRLFGQGRSVRIPHGRPGR